MGSLITHIPVLGNPSQASGGQALGGLTFSFVADGDAIPSSTPGLGRMKLEAQKLAARVGVPNELNTDAAKALGDLVNRIVAIGYAWAEDDYFIGSGTGAGCRRHHQRAVRDQRDADEQRRPAGRGGRRGDAGGAAPGGAGDRADAGDHRRRLAGVRRA